MNEIGTIPINLPRELIEEWKYLVQMRQQVEGQQIDPIEVLRQAVATETYLWQQKNSLTNQTSRGMGRIAGKGFLE